jgi:hypothetical protein
VASADPETEAYRRMQQRQAADILAIAVDSQLFSALCATSTDGQTRRGVTASCNVS